MHPSNQPYGKLHQSKATSASLSSPIRKSTAMPHTIVRISTINLSAGLTQGFLFNNIQPDFIHIDDLGPEHDVVYLPFPVMLPEETTQKLTAWVSRTDGDPCKAVALSKAMPTPRP